MKTGFLNTDIRHLEIPISRWIVGAMVGLLYALCFYALQYFTREVFRVLSVSPNFDMWVLTEEEVNVYNLFFAFMALLIGQSISFGYWFDRPKKVFVTRKRAARAVVHGARFYSWYFLSWFSRLATMYAILFGLTFYGGHYAFGLYPEYIYLLILFLLVWFFISWNSFALILGKKRWRWMLVSLITISSLSFGLSRINLVDYEALTFLSKSIHYNYNLKLLQTSSAENPRRKSLMLDIYLVTSKEGDSAKPVLIIDHEEINFDQLTSQIIDFRLQVNEAERSYVTFNLHIHKGLKMGFVNQVKDVLSTHGATNTVYAVQTSGKEFPELYYRRGVVQLRVADWTSPIYEPSMLQQHVDRIENVIKVKYHGKGYYLVNTKKIALADLRDHLKTLILQNSDFLITPYSDDEVSFGDYFSIIIAAKEAIDEIRNGYALIHFEKHYNDLYEEREKVNQKYPYKILELPLREVPDDMPSPSVY